MNPFSPGGVMSPGVGDLMVYHHPHHSAHPCAGRFEVREFAASGQGDDYESYDDAVGAAARTAAAAGVNVFFCDLPGQPRLLKHYRSQ